MNGLVAIEPGQLFDAVGLIAVGVLAMGFCGVWIGFLVRDLVLSIERWIRVRAAAKPFSERVEAQRRLSVLLRDVHARRARRLWDRLHPMRDDDCPF